MFSSTKGVYSSNPSSEWETQLVPPAKASSTDVACLQHWERAELDKCCTVHSLWAGCGQDLQLSYGHGETQDWAAPPSPSPLPGSPRRKLLQHDKSSRNASPGPHRDVWHGSPLLLCDFIPPRVSHGPAGMLPARKAASAFAFREPSPPLTRRSSSLEAHAQPGLNRVAAPSCPSTSSNPPSCSPTQIKGHQRIFQIFEKPFRTTLEKNTFKNLLLQCIQDSLLPKLVCRKPKRDRCSVSLVESTAG